MKSPVQPSFISLILLIVSLQALGQGAQPSVFDRVWTGYFRRNSGGWTAGDATISVPLPDGRVIWLFGDSYTIPVDTTDNSLPCLFQVRNCYMVQDSVDRSRFRTILDTTMTGVNQTTFKLRPNDTSLLWPGHGYVYGDTVYIFLERYNSTTLAYEGGYLARLSLPSLEQFPLIELPSAGTNVIFGRAVLPDTASGKIYIYGNRLNWIVWEPVLARAGINDPYGLWEYFTPLGWSSNPMVLQKISDEPVSPGFSVFKQNGQYCLLTQENGYLECGLGREIWSYTSPDPWGPFGNKSVLYTEESQYNGHYLLTYNAQAHPWENDSLGMLVSYNVNDRVDTTAPNICPSQCVDIWTDRLNSDTYRPKFIRVPPGLITSSSNPDPNPIHENLSVRVLSQPVPANGRIELNVRASTPWSGEISVITIDGRALWSGSYNLFMKENRIQVPAPAAAGMYFLVLKGEHWGSIAVKIIVR